MTILFGFSDTLHAMSTCFSCNVQASASTDSLNNHPPNASNPRTTSRNRIGPSHSSQSLPEALRPLLMNDSTDDEYADSLSLHSNIGESGGKKNKSTRTRPLRPGAVVLSETETDGEDTTVASTRNVQSRSKLKRRGKKKKKRDRGADGWFTAFGYHLFGKKQPAIQLPLTDDEEEDEAEAERRRRRIMRLSGSGSGTTLDSDAAPLDDAAIAAAVGRAHIVRDNEGIAPVDPMPAGNDDEAVARHANKEERRRKRRERKEREALERALDSGFSRISSLHSFTDDGGEFEGFQGSGDGASLVALKSPPSERTSVSSKREARYEVNGMDELDEVADFDGSIYARFIQTDSDPLKTSDSRTTTSTATKSSNSTPAPSSRRSGRLSHHRAHCSNDAADEFHETMFNSIDPRETSSNDTEDRKKKKSKIRSKPSPLASSSTATSSQSPSLPSPPGSAALGPGLSISLSIQPSSSQIQGPVLPTKNTNAKPGMVPGLGHEDPFLIAPREPTSAYGLDGGNRGFPSVGFGRRNSTHLNGAFLARRGD